MSLQLRLRAAAAAASLALAAMLLAAAQPAAADAAPKAGGTQRPKICLVLSGGGARGAAHVGVLKVLEEYRVPIDCIAGTSMGALIGAAYATGTTVAEMGQILGEITTELLYKENPPRQEISMRRKQDDYTLLFGPEFGVDRTGFKFPKGVVTGVQLESVLRRLAKAKGYHRFDELPIPFRAVATDLLSGKAVIFSQGELANVMRASMSVPGAVAPAEFDGMMLVDGMLTSNLPVQTARAMGADVIIAVNVGTPLLKREQINGLVGVTGQMISILTEQNVQASLAMLKPADILISPELGEYSTSDFDHLPKIAPLGEAAARELSARLTQLSLPAGEYAALRQRQSAVAEPDSRPVDEIRFVDLQRVNPKAAQAAMETRAGQPVDQQTLDRDMRRLYGSGDFEHVNYRFLEEPGRRVLAVDAVEKSWGPDYLRFGLGLSSDFKGGAYFNLLGSYRQTWLNTLGAEWRTDLQVGRTSNLTTEFYQPLNPERAFFIAPHLGVERRAVLLYQGDTNIASYDLKSSLLGVDVGTQFKRYGEFRLGVARGELSPTMDTGPAYLAPGPSHIAQGAYRARLVLDQIDSVHFPRAGWRGGMHLYKSDEGLGADQNYTKWDVDGIAAYSFGEHTFSFGVKAGGKYGSDPLPPYDQFQWGGFLQQSGYATGQLLGEHMTYGRVMYYHRIMRGTLFEGAYGGIALEAGKVGNPLVPGSPDGLLKSAAVFVALDSPIGPLYWGYGRARDGNTSLYFYVGRPF
ncbi:MAG: patatin-like phospholipase family protein [Burkholderiales bacterium]|nr:patatin-like phospholipase family protein [Burkholderiales bacterium]